MSMLTDGETEQLIVWIFSMRGKVSWIPPGVLAWVIDTARQCATLPEAKEMANEMMNEIAARNREIPLPVQELDYSFETQRRVQNIPNREIKGKTLVEHLEAATAGIESQSDLMRKISLREAAVYLDRTKVESLEHVFPEGIEGAKAFSIKRVYSFKDAQRNKQAGAYDYHLRIRLTRTLKDYLIKYLWINVYKVSGENFQYNPQIKYENSGYTVIIPGVAWRPFWQRVEVFDIVRSDGTVYKSYAEIAAAQHKDAHEDKLRAFNMETSKASAVNTMPPGAMPYVK
jgi:hypothetical protein